VDKKSRGFYIDTIIITLLEFIIIKVDHITRKVKIIGRRKDIHEYG